MTSPFQPRIDPDIDSFFSKPQSEIDPDIENFFANPPQKIGFLSRGLSAAMSGGGEIAANVFGGLGKLVELGKERSFFSDASDYFRQVAEKHNKILAGDKADTIIEKGTEFVGRVLPQAAVGGALAKTIFNPITSKLAGTAFGKAAERIASLATNNERGRAAISAAITSAPAELLGNAVTNPLVDSQNSGVGATLLGTGFGMGVNAAFASRAITSAAKEVLKNREVIPIDQQNQAFDAVVEEAKKVASEMRTVFKEVFPDLTGKKVTADVFDPRFELKSAVYSVQNILKSFTIDGVTASNLKSLEDAQNKIKTLIDDFAAENTGQLREVELKGLAKLYNFADEVSVPEYNFLAPTPAVSAIQRLKDNVELDDGIRMNPEAPLGSAESLVASTRPDSPSAYGAIRGFFQRSREQYQNYKSGLQIFGDDNNARNVYNYALRLSGNNGRVYQNLEVQPKLLNAATGEWEDAVIDGVKVKSMNQILKEVGTDDATLSKLNGYVIAKQVADGNLNITGFTKEWGEAEVKRLTLENPAIAQAGNDFFLRGKMMAKYMEDILGTEVTEEWLKRDYAPAARALQKKGDPFGFKTGRKGGDELVYNPIAKHIENTSVAIAATEKARMWRKLYEVIKNSGSEYANSAEIVETNPKVMQRILDAVKDANPELDELAARKMANLIAGTSPDKTAKTVTFLVDGELRSIRFSDDFNELFNGFEGPAEIGMLAKVAQRAESIPRTLFSLVNDLTLLGPSRDLVETFMNDPNIPKNPLGFGKILGDFIRGYKEVANQGELFQRVLASGGGIGGRYIGPSGGVAELTLDAMKKQVQGNYDSWLQPLKKLEKISANLSQASRMGAAIRVFEKNGSSDEAAQIFRAVIADPQQVGSKMQAAARLTAFMNMGVQSAAKTAEQFKRNPAATMIKGMEGIALPAAVLWYYNRNDADIQELRNSKGGENYFYFRFGDDGEIIRFPKPYLYGQVFGTGIETILDGIAGTNPQAVDQFMQGIWGQLSVNVLPLSTQALANTVMGQKYLGLGEGLIPSGGSTNPQMPEDQRFLNTTTLARTIAEKTGISASGIDDVMRTFLTNEPYKLVAYFDRKLTNRTAPTREDIPFIGKVFPTTDKANLGSVNRFYDMGNKYGDILASFQDAERKGDAERLQKLVDNHKDDLSQAMVFAEGVKDVQEMRAAINMINENKLMTPEERREKITQLNSAIREYTSLFLQAWDKKK